MSTQSIWVQDYSLVKSLEYFLCYVTAAASSIWPQEAIFWAGNMLLNTECLLALILGALLLIESQMATSSFVRSNVTYDHLPNPQHTIDTVDRHPMDTMSLICPLWEPCQGCACCPPDEAPGTRVICQGPNVTHIPLGLPQDTVKMWVTLKSWQVRLQGT